MVLLHVMRRQWAQTGVLALVSLLAFIAVVAVGGTSSSVSAQSTCADVNVNNLTLTFPNNDCHYKVIDIDRGWSEHCNSWSSNRSCGQLTNGHSYKVDKWTSGWSGAGSQTFTAEDNGGTLSIAAPRITNVQVGEGYARLDFSEVAGAGGYNVYRNGSYFETISGSPYEDRDTPGQYTYYVTAFDTTKQHFSERSNEVSADTRGTGSDNTDSKGLVCKGNTQFFDDFDGSAIDSKKWKTGLYWGDHDNPPNNEQQRYARDLRDQVFQVGSGSLKIRPTRSGGRFTSGALTALEYDPEDSMGRAGQSPNYERVGESEAFGRGCYEIRAKFPDRPKAFPAFWLISNHGPSAERPEIDVIETLGHRDVFWTNAHGLGSRGDKKTGQRHNGRDVVGYHVYSARWTNSAIIWYRDGVELTRTTDHLPYTNDMFLHLNYALGGNWSESVWGSPVDRSFFATTPPALEVDYVVVTD